MRAASNCTVEAAVTALQVNHKAILKKGKTGLRGLLRRRRGSDYRKPPLEHRAKCEPGDDSPCQLEQGAAGDASTDEGPSCFFSSGRIAGSPIKSKLPTVAFVVFCQELGLGELASNQAEGIPGNFHSHVRVIARRTQLLPGPFLPLRAEHIRSTALGCHVFRIRHELVISSELAIKSTLLQPIPCYPRPSRWAPAGLDVRLRMALIMSIGMGRIVLFRSPAI